MKVVAIDGPAAAGKGAVSPLLAEKLSMSYFSSGVIYRLVAKEAMMQGVEASNLQDLLSVAASIASTADLDIRGENPDLRSENVSMFASIIASSKQLRKALVDVQRSIISQNGDGNGIVVDGRDIGTVIYPEAICKFFITADVKERAKRRFIQLQLQDQQVIYEDVLRDLSERDERDASREVAPLRPASDAVVIDNTNLTECDVLEKLFKIASEKLGILV
jgi:cytidylate kinase